MRKFGQTSLPAWQVLMAVLLVAQLGMYPFGVTAKQDKDKEDKSEMVAVITQSGPDEGDNRHPSGKDRSEEPGKSGTQGKSESDPDGAENANGGTNQDKIGYTGGFDKADQDNNNGCGNDDDFEDDNNGNCRKNQPKPTHTPYPTATPAPTATPTPTVTPTSTPVPTCTPAPTATPVPCNCSCTNNCNNNNQINNDKGSVLGASLPKTGVNQTRMGWVMRMIAIGLGNIVLFFPSKKWMGVA